MGANCGTGSDELIEAIRAIKSTNPELPLIAKANAGIPEMVGTEVVYNGSPEVMADYAVKVWKRSPVDRRLLRKHPDHIRAMADALENLA